MATINDLPAEIICEIAKYDMGYTLRLGLTCKNFNEILKEKIDKNKIIAKNNKELEKEISELNEKAITLYFDNESIYGGNNNEIRKEINEIGKKINILKKRLLCVNCYKEFVFNNLCEDCAEKLSIDNSWQAPNHFLLFIDDSSNDSSDDDDSDDNDSDDNDN